MRCFTYPGDRPSIDDYNFWGRTRNNITQLPADAVRRRT